MVVAVARRAHDRARARETSEVVGRERADFGTGWDNIMAQTLLGAAWCWAEPLEEVVLVVVDDDDNDAILEARPKRAAFCDTLLFR